MNDKLFQNYFSQIANPEYRQAQQQQDLFSNLLQYGAQMRAAGAPTTNVGQPALLASQALGTLGQNMNKGNQNYQNQLMNAIKLKSLMRENELAQGELAARKAFAELYPENSPERAAILAGVSLNQIQPKGFDRKQARAIWIKAHERTPDGKFAYPELRKSSKFQMAFNMMTTPHYHYDPNRGWVTLPAQADPKTGKLYNVPEGAVSPQAPTDNAITQPPPTLVSKRPIPEAGMAAIRDSNEKISIAQNIQADLRGFSDKISEGKLNLGVLNNAISAGLNFIGESTEETRNYSAFKSTLEKIRNESLRLNKGMQTEGDAERALNELFENLNDEGVVKQRLDQLQVINARAVALHKANRAATYQNYGEKAPPISKPTPITDIRPKKDPPPAGIRQELWDLLSKDEKALWR